MSELNITLAPSGALTLRQTPEFDLERALGRAVFRLTLMELRRKRRTDQLEGAMHPDQHNFISTHAQGSMLNAGQFGSVFAQHPCHGAESKRQAYDALVPARPQRSLKQRLTTLFRAKS